MRFGLTVNELYLLRLLLALFSAFIARLNASCMYCAYCGRFTAGAVLYCTAGDENCTVCAPLVMTDGIQVIQHVALEIANAVGEAKAQREEENRET